MKVERSLSTQRQATARAKDKGRIGAKVYAGVGAVSALGGYALGEFIEEKAWTIGERTDPRVVVGPVSMGVGGVLMLRRKTRQGAALVIAVFLLFGGIGVLWSYLWSEWMMDRGGYSDSDPDPQTLEMNQNVEGVYEYAEAFQFAEV